MADESLRFDIVGDDRVSGAFSRAGASAGELSRKMDAAARSSAILDEALDKQRRAARAGVDATLALAKADDILKEAEHGLRDGALEAEFALKREAEAAKKSGEAARKAAAENRGLAASLARIADSAKGKGGPAWLGPALALAPAATILGGVGAGAAIGLGGAAVAGGGALAAFGAVAKPVFAAAQKAAQAAEKAQNNYTIAIASGANQAKAYKAEQIAIAKAYAELSPAQIALSKQIQAMGNAWQDVKAAQTPVVAGALQPWLKAVTGLTKNLGPIIAKVAPVIKGLGIQFDALVNSAAFRGFRDFVANTGSKVVGAVGGTLIDFVKAFMILLPKFNPLILKMTGGIAALGPAVLKWANSKKTADDITKFMDWFSKNGPLVWGLLKNIGGALKALAPGLTSGGTLELQAMSGFFAFIAKLPPALAKPLIETAGVLLTLNKLGVFPVGVKFVGLAAGWVKKLVTGASVDLGARGMQRAGDTMLAAAAEMNTAARTMAGGAAAGGAGGAAGKGAAAAGAGLSFVSKAGLAAAGAAIAGGLVLKLREDFTAGWKGFLKDLPGLLSGATGILNVSATGWTHAILDRFDKPVRAMWHDLGHFLAASFDDTRHQVAGVADGLGRYLAGSFGKTRGQVTSVWDTMWRNTITRTAGGFHDVAGWFDTGRHWIAASLGLVRSGAAIAWNTIWNDTAGRTRRGISDVMGSIGTLPGRIKGVFAFARGWLYNEGQAIIQGLWDGLLFVWHKVTSWISSLAGWIKAHKGPVSLDRRLLEPAGRALMEGLRIGLLGGFVDIKNIITGAAGDIGSWIAGTGSKLGGAIGHFFSGLFGGGGGHVGWSPGAGVGQWTSTVQRALAQLGLSQNLVLDVLYQMMTESGGNPNAVNRTDSNWLAGHPSVGLMQVIAGTFARFAGPYRNTGPFAYGVSENPMANIYAALNYGKHGRGFGTGPGQIGSGHGYASGTPWAAPGWAWVGERGPELMRFRGGEQVGPVARAAPRGGCGDTYVFNLTVNAPVGSNPRDIGRQLSEFILAHTRAGGRLYPQGAVPR